MRKPKPHMDVSIMHPDEVAALVDQRRIIEASPYIWRDPRTLPRRPWVYGRWLLRGTVTCVIAPGGAGKSTMLAGMALALASGRPIFGQTVWSGPKRVWTWNLEDDLDEMTRSIQAAALHHGIEPEDIEGRLFVDSGMEGAMLCTATDNDGQFKLDEGVFKALVAELKRRGIDVLFVDPFVSSHEVDENSNNKVDKIVKEWARVAKAANCCIVLVHHTSKAGSAEVTAMSARGAGALVNAARSALVLNRMTEEMASKYGISADERRCLVSVSDDKHNRAPVAQADWFKLIGVDLRNGDDCASGDNVAVAVWWKPPEPFDGLTVRDLAAVQDVIADGDWRADPQSAAWAGKAVAQVLGLDVENPRDKARIKALLKEWIANKAFVTFEAKGPKGKVVDFLKVGELVDLAPPRQGRAKKVTSG
ncbi:AAA family ATPase [Novosphingobium sp.]|uniref:AAA family ATPase n=1 Tax=Novosphingobium sp. TaxID=1874826 RepID=UPI0038BCB9E3